MTYAIYSRSQDTYVIHPASGERALFATRAAAIAHRAEIIDSIPSKYLPLSIRSMRELSREEV